MLDCCCSQGTGPCCLQRTDRTDPCCSDRTDPRYPKRKDPCCWNVERWIDKHECKNLLANFLFWQFVLPLGRTSHVHRRDFMLYVLLCSVVQYNVNQCCASGSESSRIRTHSVRFGPDLFWSDPDSEVWDLIQIRGLKMYFLITFFGLTSIMNTLKYMYHNF
jgi:hypothetical protein